MARKSITGQQFRNGLLPAPSVDQVVHHTDQQVEIKPTGTGVMPIGSMPDTPAQPEHGDHTPHPGSPTD